MARWSDPEADYDAIGAEQAALEDRIEAADAWSLERNVDIAMDALRCPPDDADVTGGRTAAPDPVQEARQVVGKRTERRPALPPRTRR